VARRVDKSSEINDSPPKEHSEIKRLAARISAAKNKRFSA
jgi:hypothetical protein